MYLFVVCILSDAVGGGILERNEIFSFTRNANHIMRKLGMDSH